VDSVILGEYIKVLLKRTNRDSCQHCPIRDSHRAHVDSKQYPLEMAWPGKVNIKSLDVD